MADETQNPTDKTFTGKHFADVMAQWPSGESTLASIAETVLRGDGAEFKDFGTDYTVEGDQLVATFHDGNIRRTDAAEFMTAVGQRYPAQLEAAESDIEQEHFAALTTRQKLDFLLSDDCHLSEYQQLRGTVELLSTLDGVQSHTTSDLTEYKLQDGKLIVRDVDPASEEKHWSIYDANDLSVINSHTREELAREMRIDEAAFMETLEQTLLHMREEGVSEVENQRHGTFRLEGDMITLVQSDGDFSARALNDLSTDLTDEQIAAHRAPTEQTRSLPVSDAVLDEVFEKHADPYMRSVHGLDDAMPALSSEQVAQLVVQPSEEDRRSQADESFKHGFPSNFMAAEIDEFTANVEAARAYWAENPHPLNQTPSMETPSEDQVDYGPAVESVRKLRFAAMADRAEAAARDDKGGRTLETTNEQGV